MYMFQCTFNRVIARDLSKNRFWGLDVTFISKSMTARAVKLSMKTCRHANVYSHTWVFQRTLKIY